MTFRNFQWRHGLRLFSCVLLALVIVVAAASDADAARKKRNTGKAKKRPAVARVLGVNDPRYADVILNPVTGEIYHSDSADEKRYPASLTKMMTLYLLFEALAQEKTSLGAHLDISDYATTMPQTHLSLHAGDTIPVEVAIKALVIRSANDVSVVVAEALGGDVDNFARMMTAKARALGMKNTVFKNPNGLPNSGQYTTARDMAKLGIALKRDFPQYYDYFSARQFSWNGVTYYTHNRVMLRYAGTDGIKTGYIGLSGFNLVTSVTRGGRPLVGVVMGGGTGAWRDNRMIELLDDSYKIIAQRGAARGQIFTDNLPLQKNPQTGKSSGKGINAKSVVGMDAAEAAETLSDEQLQMPGDAGEEEYSNEAAPMQNVAPAVVAPVAAPVATHTPQPVTAPVVVAPVVQTPAPVTTAPAPQSQSQPQKPNFIRIVSVPPAKPAPAPAAKPAPVVKTIPPQVAPTQKPAPAVSAPVVNTPVVATPIAPSVPTTPTVTPIKPAPVSSPFNAVTQQPAAQPAPVASAGGWGIQVGAFTSSDLATRAANDAYNLAKTSLSGARLAVAGPEAGGAPVHRARLVNLTEKQAKDTCKTLIAHSTPCFTYKAN